MSERVCKCLAYTSSFRTHTHTPRNNIIFHLFSRLCVCVCAPYPFNEKNNKYTLCENESKRKQIVFMTSVSVLVCKWIRGVHLAFSHPTKYSVLYTIMMAVTVMSTTTQEHFCNKIRNPLRSLCKKYFVIRYAIRPGNTKRYDEHPAPDARASTNSVRENMQN